MADINSYGKQDINQDDINEVIKALKSPALTGGSYVESFATALKNAVNAPSASVCANGTVALHLLYQALGITQDDIVIVPTITFMATANGARYLGANIYFADVDPLSGLLTVESIQNAINDLDQHNLKAKAVVPVHMGGQACDMPKIRDLATKHNLLVIEDACHALGTTYEDSQGKSHKVGACSHSDGVVFSFHPVKTITSGEGGGITSSVDIIQTVKALTGHGIIRNVNDQPWYHEMQMLGYNYRITDIQSALGLSQMQRLDQFVKKRQELINQYIKACENTPIKFAVNPDVVHTTSWHLFVSHIDFNKHHTTRTNVMNTLRNTHEIGSQVHYIPVHSQPYWRKNSLNSKLNSSELTHALEYYQSCLSLPLFPLMDLTDPKRVIDALQDILK